MCSPSGLVFCILSVVLFSSNCLLSYAAVDGDNTSSSSSRKNSNPGSGLRIDITRKRSIEFNGVEIDENSLLEHLEDHERELIFGKENKKREVKLVHLRHRTDADNVTTWEVPKQQQQAKQQHNQHQRVKRSDTAAAPEPSGAQPSQEVLVQIQDDDADLVNLHLHPTPKLIDDAFIFIRRYANTTQFIEDSHKLVQRYANCFYSNENSALDLCDEENVRGILHHNATDFIIHPLPPRFGNTTHVILAAASNDRDASSYHDLFPLPPTIKLTKDMDKLDENIQFEPDEEDFNELKRPTRNIKSTKDQQEAADRHSFNSSNIKQHHQKFAFPSYEPRYHYEQEHHSRHTAHSKSHSRSRLNQSQQAHQSYHKHRQHQHRNHHQHQHHRRRRRHISSGSQWSIPEVLHIETAIFVDNDLYKHMARNFPIDTENHLIRFVLAMINGVQLLYHHPSLGHRVDFVLKRLEILFKDPPDLGRSSNIDTYLSNFCLWQKSLNPASDADAVHYDHAVILTGLDLYVVGKNGKVISQVVGLAPVAGMCTLTSSCTINEGKHFESVFVVAHEIGHNLGMRHDTKDNSCDPTLYIMSPTLGSGKITWSKCSRTYLNTFLETNQAKCLFDRGQFVNNLDHSAEGKLPGERFDANQQCMLKYGKDTVRARSQAISDICRDLHCQQDRFTWTSHPALEGTECGDSMWCRSGVCALMPNTRESLVTPKQLQNTAKLGYDKASFLDSNKMGHLLHDYNYNKASPSWASWGEASACESGCLYGPSKRLREGSTGLKTYTRSCLDYRRRCHGRDRKFESCIAKQCHSIAIMTVESFATQVCEKAQKFDAELTGEGAQIVGNIEESCKIFCKTKSNSTKSRSWTFPDGTTCRSKEYNYDDTAYCIAGCCERFSCDNNTNNYYKIDPIFCQYRKPSSYQAPTPLVYENNQRSSDNKQYSNRYASRDNNYSNVINNNRNFSPNIPSTQRSKYENEVALRSNQQNTQTYKRKSDPYQAWNKYNYQLNEQRPTAATPPTPPPQPPPPAAPISASLIKLPPESEWIVKSGCHSSCIAKSRGIQVVSSRRTGANNIQLCSHTVKPCERLQTPTEYAENTCSRYKLKVRGLSGHGTQIAASVDEPDRSCRVGCQDEYIKYRFYLVNGKYGHFPLGTRCSNTEERYCVNGKCLEFGEDKIPLQQSHISLALFRNRRSLPEPVNVVTARTQPNQSNELSASEKDGRTKRSFLYYSPVNITETITQDFINNIINSIVEYEQEQQQQIFDELTTLASDHIDLNKPIHVTTEEMTTA